MKKQDWPAIIFASTLMLLGLSFTGQLSAQEKEPASPPAEMTEAEKKRDEILRTPIHFRPQPKRGT